MELKIAQIEYSSRAIIAQSSDCWGMDTNTKYILDF